MRLEAQWHLISCDVSSRNPNLDHKRNTGCGSVAPLGLIKRQLSLAVPRLTPWATDLSTATAALIVVPTISQRTSSATYDLTKGEGARIWNECLARMATLGRYATSVIGDLPIPAGFGTPALVAPPLGQKSFRVAVLDTYDRRCAITSERTLPVLEAAHIRPFAEAVDHSVTNGILFRSDFHKLFYRGYLDDGGRLEGGGTAG